MKAIRIIITVVFFITILAVHPLMAQRGQTEKARSETSMDTLKVNLEEDGLEMVITFRKGKAHNHPSFVFWLEDIEGQYIQTLFVTESVGTGIYGRADAGNGRWKNEPGESIRPASLPYWAHKRGILSRGNLYIPTPENPVPDAYTGATPPQDFVLKARSDEQPGRKFRVLMEINQPWDWNDYWNNTRYPGDRDYHSSCQPSAIYAVTIDLDKYESALYLNPIGHGHYSGDDGRLYTNLTTLTTALDIVAEVKVAIK
jgi:hypothetical protein